MDKEVPDLPERYRVAGVPSTGRGGVRRIILATG